MEGDGSAQRVNLYIFESWDDPEHTELKGAQLRPTALSSGRSGENTGEFEPVGFKYAGGASIAGRSVSGWHRAEYPGDWTLPSNSSPPLWTSSAQHRSEPQSS